jgi:hypothetical protein
VGPGKPSRLRRLYGIRYYLLWKEDLYSMADLTGIPNGQVGSVRRAAPCRTGPDGKARDVRDRRGIAQHSARRRPFARP